MIDDNKIKMARKPGKAQKKNSINHKQDIKSIQKVMMRFCFK